MSKFFDFGNEEISKPEIKIPIKPIDNNYQFQYKGKTYECIGEDRDFQILQFNCCIEQRDWVTLKNRITNQLMWGPNIKKL